MYDDVTPCMMMWHYVWALRTYGGIARWCDTMYDDVTPCMMMWHYVWALRTYEGIAKCRHIRSANSCPWPALALDVCWMALSSSFRQCCAVLLSFFLSFLFKQEQKDLNLFALFLSSTSFCSFSFLYIFLLLELRALWGERARSGRESAFVYCDDSVKRDLI